VTNPINLEPSAKAERTRSAILAASEQMFARGGYAATRLEDVAEVVGLTRAALFYYFRDKQTLFDAMLDNAFGSLATHLDDALSMPGSVIARIEGAVNAWVDAVVARPTIANLLLRYAADAEQQSSQQIYSSSERLFRTYWELVELGRANGELKPLHDNPLHATSAVIGHTVFYISAMATLLPSEDFKSLAPEQVEAHKHDLMLTVRHQLGIVSGRQTKKRNKS
jgi:TetR/AcrR family transcriptional regulator